MSASINKHAIGDDDDVALSLLFFWRHAASKRAEIKSNPTELDGNVRKQESTNCSLCLSQSRCDDHEDSHQD